MYLTILHYVLSDTFCLCLSHHQAVTVQGFNQGIWVYILIKEESPGLPKSIIGSSSEPPISVQAICLHSFPKTLFNITLNYISSLSEYSVALDFFCKHSLVTLALETATYAIMCARAVLKNVLLIADLMQILSF